jgi:hypothetical protein
VAQHCTVLFCRGVLLVTQPDEREGAGGEKVARLRLQPACEAEDGLVVLRIWMRAGTDRAEVPGRDRWMMARPMARTVQPYAAGLACRGGGSRVLAALSSPSPGRSSFTIT